MKSITFLHFFILLVFSSFIYGCQSNKQMEERLKRLEKENKELKKSLHNDEGGTNPESNDYINDNNNNSSTYAFVVLKVTQREYNENYTNKITKTYNFCSAIKSFNYLNEDLKYQFMDAVQNSYSNSAGANLYDGAVIDRNIYTFRTYEEASMEREKYTVRKN